jgi:Flp pilus assembly protein TadB
VVALVASLAGIGTGASLLFTSHSADRRPGRSAAALRRRLGALVPGSPSPWPWLRRSVAAGVLLGLVAWLLVPSPVAAACGFVVGAIWPVRRARAEAERRRREALAAWPRLLQSIRVQVTTLGLPLPSAILEAARQAPAPMAPAFGAFSTSWNRTTDLSRALDDLASVMADPTTDLVADTLALGFELGGGSLDRRLARLIEERERELELRQEAEARLAGARFARRFVLLVPAAMALAAEGIGSGPRTFSGPLGAEVLVVCALLSALCWWWAGRLLRLPEATRSARHP